MHYVHLLLLPGLLLLLNSCQPAPPRDYIFLGHPYDYHDLERVDPRVEKILTYPFDEVWFGGDVCGHTAISESNLAYLDSLIGALPGEVHWTLGNHDINYGPVDRVLSLRKRPPFYTTYRDGVCIVVLNTNLFWYYPSNPPQDNCVEKESQLAMLKAVADTISVASHLIVLHHHGLFTEMLNDDSGRPINAFNVNAGSIRAACDSASYVNEVIYPALAKVQNRGVQVLCIGGDVGMVAKEFTFRTPEGMVLLGSGINNSQPKEFAPEYVTSFDPDKVLWLQHWPREQRLEWKFVDLDSLVLSTVQD